MGRVKRAVRREERPPAVAGLERNRKRGRAVRTKGTEQNNKKRIVKKRDGGERKNSARNSSDEKIPEISHSLIAILGFT